VKEFVCLAALASMQLKSLTSREIILNTGNVKYIGQLLASPIALRPSQILGHWVMAPEA